MTYCINPDFAALRESLSRLPDYFEHEGRTIYKGRNELKIFEKHGLVLNVKSYRKPIWLNRVVYTFFRKSKARRAYENAQMLISKGFETPLPVAYLEIHSGGLLSQSYFVSIHCPYSRMFREFADGSSIEGRQEIIRSFGVLMAHFHEAGILHLDLSIGNVLFEEMPDGVHFSVVDLNRMKFCKIGLKEGARNFERLRGNREFFELLSNTYAEARGLDPEQCLQLVMKYQQKSVRHFQRKRRMKNRFSR